MAPVANTCVSFVPAKPEDFDYFYRLRKETMMEHFVRAGKGWPEEQELKLHREAFDNNLTFLRMVHMDGRRIGFLIVAPHEDGIIIERFCIEPADQKKGIGTRIMDTVLGEPEICGKTIYVDVLHENPAIHIYERLGFNRYTPEDTGDGKLSFYKRIPRLGFERRLTPSTQKL